MSEDMISFIDNLKKNSRLLSYSEDQTKMAIVLPILRRLGWDTENIDDVCPEFSVEGRRVDYALLLKGQSIVFIEVKKTSEDLDNQDHQEQLLDYSFRQGVKIAVLTNGITWSFYLPIADVNWRLRKFYTIDIIEQETSSVVKKFVDLLSKKNIESGEALHNAEIIHEDKMKERAIQEALPEAWNRIIEEPDPLLIDLLSERTERISSYKPELTEVIKFLMNHQTQFLLLPVEDQTESGKEPVSRTREEHSIKEIPDDKKISQDDLVKYIIDVLKKYGGRAKKEQVEKEIYGMFKNTFDHPWYQEKVSIGVPRWQHNLAWAKERAKNRGLIKRPAESGRGFWELTDKGMKS